MRWIIWCCTALSGCLLSRCLQTCKRPPRSQCSAHPLSLRSAGMSREGTGGGTQPSGGLCIQHGWWRSVLAEIWAAPMALCHQRESRGGGRGGIIKCVCLFFCLFFPSYLKFLKCRFKEKVITFCNGHSSNRGVICNGNILRARWNVANDLLCQVIR